MVNNKHSKNKSSISTFINRSKRNLTAFILAFVVILLVGVGFIIVNKQTSFASAVPQYNNLGYPWNNAHTIDVATSDWGYINCPSDAPKCKNPIANSNTDNGKYGVADPWGYEFKNCTSYVAWKENQLGITVSNGLGNGGDWYKKSPSYEQSLTPQAGDAAVKPGAHVAYVESVNSANNTITVSEYNEDLKGDGDYRTGTATSMGFTEFVNFRATPPATNKQTNNQVNSNPSNKSNTNTVITNVQNLQPASKGTSIQGSGSQNTKIINNTSNTNQSGNSNGSPVQTMTNTTPSSYIVGNPAVLSRGSDSMDVFYRTNDNKLINKSWNASTGWSTQQLADDIADNPVATMRNGGMEVFYRMTNGNIGNVGWNSSQGWHPSVQIASGNFNGDPGAVSRTSDSMDVFVRNSNNDLVKYSWNSADGWYSSQTLVNGDITSNPEVISRSASSMNVFYQNGSNHLANEWWDESTGWHSQDLQANMIGNPDPIARTTNNMDVFYRNPNSNLAESDWDVNTGWHNASWGGQLSGDPSVAARTSGNMDVMYREDPGNIKEEWWDWTIGWNTSGNYATDVSGDPIVLARSKDNLEVFYRSFDNTLKDINWSSETGWNSPTTPN